MELKEAKQILNSNGYLLEDSAEPITVSHIDRRNYKDYIGEFVNVTGDVNLSYLHLKELPIKFGTVGGNFTCYYNQLTTLRGAPTEVGEWFMCSNNNLTSLEGAPEKVGGNFECDYNKLITLDCSPKEVGGNFSCHHNKKKFSKYYVREVSNVEGEIWV